MKRLSLVFIISLFALQLFPQQYIVRFRFKDLFDIPHFVSIDYVKGNNAVAYIWGQDNYQRFIQQFPQAQLVNDYKKSKAIVMAQTPAEMASWDRYPTYETYVQMMKDFASNYPTICRLDTIGTSQQGRLLLSVVISDNPRDTLEFEPRFFYTSTMHGDETVGYVVLLRLIDYLLTNYNKDSLVTYLVNNYMIYINPLANPDGTYHGGNSTVTGAQRYYANGVDPNRNFGPLPGGNTPDDNTVCPETEAMKQYAAKNHFTMSMNIHGGAEVFNYPWDVYTSAHAHADDQWFRTIGERFVQTARQIDPNYMTDTYASGVTEGGDWYVVSGSRQDYMNFTQHCKEVTLEISSTKLPGSDQLPYFWDVSYRSLLNYILEAEHGLQGIIVDTNGQALKTRIFLNNYDRDSSDVYSLSGSGVYFRPLLAGQYDLSLINQGDTLLRDTVDVTGGRTIYNYIPVHQQHSVTFQLVDGSGNPVNGVNMSIQGPNDTITAVVNGQYTVSLPTGVYSVHVQAHDLGYNQLFYEAILGDDTIKYVLTPPPVTVVEDLQQPRDLIVYPVPAHTWINVKAQGIKNVRIYSITGRILMENKIAGNHVQLNLSGLGPGIYLLRVETDQSHYPLMRKIVVR